MLFHWDGICCAHRTSLYTTQSCRILKAQCVFLQAHCTCKQLNVEKNRWLAHKQKAKMKGIGEQIQLKNSSKMRKIHYSHMAYFQSDPFSENSSPVSRHKTQTLYSECLFEFSLQCLACHCWYNTQTGSLGSSRRAGEKGKRNLWVYRVEGNRGGTGLRAKNQHQDR